MAMSDSQLSRAWTASYTQLLSAERETGQAGVARIAGTAAERLCYLDEMQRRQPGRVTAWIASGARASSDPSRHRIGPIPIQRRPRDT